MSAGPAQLAEAYAEARGTGPDGRPDSVVGATTQAPSSKRVLEPIERISEVLFGLIMVLTFTCSLSVAEAGRSEVRGMLVGALGCNLAWGVIDGIMYLMACLAEKARALATLRAIQTAADPQQAQRVIAGVLPPAIAPTVGTEELERIRLHLQTLPRPAAYPRLSQRDWLGAAGVFLLVVLSTCPVVLPFVFMQNAMRAQRVSNLVAIGMLFLTGYSFGRCTGYHPRGMGVTMVVIGGILVGLTILLGG